MTRRDALICFNEPFIEPSSFGPEACIERQYADGEKGHRPGFESCTFKDRVDLIENKNGLDEVL